MGGVFKFYRKYWLVETKLHFHISLICKTDVCETIQGKFLTLWNQRYSSFVLWAISKIIAYFSDELEKKQLVMSAIVLFFFFFHLAMGCILASFSITAKCNCSSFRIGTKYVEYRNTEQCLCNTRQNLPSLFVWLIKLFFVHLVDRYINHAEDTR